MMPSAVFAVETWKHGEFREFPGGGGAFVWPRQDKALAPTRRREQRDQALAIVYNPL